MQEIIDKLNFMLSENYSAEQISNIDTFLHVILHEYDIRKKETAVQVYQGNQDEILTKKFLATKMVKGCSRRTIKMYSNALLMFRKKIQKPLVEITSDDILYYLAMRGTIDGISPVSQNNELRVLKSFYVWATNEDIVPKNPTAKISQIKTQKKVKEAFTEIELEKLREACNTRKGLNKKHLAILEVLISTGCRASELATMKLENLLGDKITILGKGNKERIVYLNARAQMALTNYLSVRENNSPYIFPGIDIKTKEPTDHIGYETVNEIVKTLAKRAGVKNCHAHRFRRTAATMALRKGMPVELVSKMLGHEQLTTTQIYLQLSDEDLHNAHKKYC